jgi:hypothetical protein
VITVPILFGFLIFMAMGWAAVKAGEAAVNAIAGSYRQRHAAFAQRHPQSNHAVATAAGIASAVWHGTKPAWRAAKHDWAKHWALKRDEVRNRFDRPTAPPATQSADDSADVAPIEDIITDPTGTPFAPAPPPPAAPAPAPFSPRLIRGGLDTAPPMEGRPVLTMNATEVRTIADLRRQVDQFADVQRSELEDATSALRRAEADLAYVTSLGEAAVLILDQDPATAAMIAGLAEPAQARVGEARGRVAAADAALGRAAAAKAGLDKHRAMEEAVAATPQRSSNTEAYAQQ